MKNPFELISLADAMTRYHTHQKIYEDEGDFNAFIEPDSYFYVHEGDLRVDEDFILDTDELADASPDKWICGYIINGDLIVNGSVLNEEGDEHIADALTALLKNPFIYQTHSSQKSYVIWQ